MSKKYKVGDLVWAKMKGYPHWPARVDNPPSQLKSPSNKYYVFFYGTLQYGWITEGDLCPYAEFKEKYTKVSMRKGFSEAVWQIEEDPFLTISSAVETPPRKKKKKSTSVKKESTPLETSSPPSVVSSSSLTRSSRSQKRHHPTDASGETPSFKRSASPRVLDQEIGDLKIPNQPLLCSTTTSEDPLAVPSKRGSSKRGVARRSKRERSVTPVIGSPLDPSHQPRANKVLCLSDKENLTTDSDPVITSSSATSDVIRITSTIPGESEGGVKSSHDSSIKSHDSVTSPVTKRYSTRSSCALRSNEGDDDEGGYVKKLTKNYAARKEQAMTSPTTRRAPNSSILTSPTLSAASSGLGGKGDEVCLKKASTAQKERNLQKSTSQNDDESDASVQPTSIKKLSCTDGLTTSSVGEKEYEDSKECSQTVGEKKKKTYSLKGGDARMWKKSSGGSSGRAKGAKVTETKIWNTRSSARRQLRSSASAENEIETKGGTCENVKMESPSSVTVASSVGTGGKDGPSASVCDPKDQTACPEDQSSHPDALLVCPESCPEDRSTSPEAQLACTDVLPPKGTMPGGITKALVLESDEVSNVSVPESDEIANTSVPELDEITKISVPESDKTLVPESDRITNTLVPEPNPISNELTDVCTKPVKNESDFGIDSEPVTTLNSLLSGDGGGQLPIPTARVIHSLTATSAEYVPASSDITPADADIKPTPSDDATSDVLSTGIGTKFVIPTDDNSCSTASDQPPSVTSDILSTDSDTKFSLLTPNVDPVPPSSNIMSTNIASSFGGDFPGTSSRGGAEPVITTSSISVPPQIFERNLPGTPPILGIGNVTPSCSTPRPLPLSGGNFLGTPPGPHPPGGGNLPGTPSIEMGPPVIAAPPSSMPHPLHGRNFPGTPSMEMEHVVATPPASTPLLSVNELSASGDAVEALLSANNDAMFDFDPSIMSLLDEVPDTMWEGSMVADGSNLMAGNGNLAGISNLVAGSSNLATGVSNLGSPATCISNTNLVGNGSNSATNVSNLTTNVSNLVSVCSNLSTGVLAGSNTVLTSEDATITSSENSSLPLSTERNDETVHLDQEGQSTTVSDHDSKTNTATPNMVVSGDSKADTATPNIVVSGDSKADTATPNMVVSGDSEANTIAPNMALSDDSKTDTIEQDLKVEEEITRDEAIILLADDQGDTKAEKFDDDDGDAVKTEKTLTGASDEIVDNHEMQVIAGGSDHEVVTSVGDVAGESEVVTSVGDIIGMSEVVTSVGDVAGESEMITSIGDIAGVSEVITSVGDIAGVSDHLEVVTSIGDVAGGSDREVVTSVGDECEKGMSVVMMEKEDNCQKRNEETTVSVSGEDVEVASVKEEDECHSKMEVIKEEPYSKMENVEKPLSKMDPESKMENIEMKDEPYSKMEVSVTSEARETGDDGVVSVSTVTQDEEPCKMEVGDESATKDFDKLREMAEEEEGQCLGIEGNEDNEIEGQGKEDVKVGVSEDLVISVKESENFKETLPPGDNEKSRLEEAKLVEIEDDVGDKCKKEEEKEIPAVSSRKLRSSSRIATRKTAATTISSSSTAKKKTSSDSVADSADSSSRCSRTLRSRVRSASGNPEMNDSSPSKRPRIDTSSTDASRALQLPSEESQKSGLKSEDSKVEKTPDPSTKAAEKSLNEVNESLEGETSEPFPEASQSDVSCTETTEKVKKLVDKFERITRRKSGSDERQSEPLKVMSQKLRKRVDKQDKMSSDVSDKGEQGQKKFSERLKKIDLLKKEAELARPSSSDGETKNHEKLTEKQKKSKSSKKVSKEKEDLSSNVASEAQESTKSHEKLTEKQKSKSSKKGAKEKEDLSGDIASEHQESTKSHEKLTEKQKKLNLLKKVAEEKEALSSESQKSHKRLSKKIESLKKEKEQDKLSSNVLQDKPSSDEPTKDHKKPSAKRKRVDSSNESEKSSTPVSDKSQKSQKKTSHGSTGTFYSTRRRAHLDSASTVLKSPPVQSKKKVISKDKDKLIDLSSDDSKADNKEMPNDKDVAKGLKIEELKEEVKISKTDGQSTCEKKVSSEGPNKAAKKDGEVSSVGESVDKDDGKSSSSLDQHRSILSLGGGSNKKAHPESSEKELLAEEQKDNNNNEVIIAGTTSSSSECKKIGNEVEGKGADVTTGTMAKENLSTFHKGILNSNRPPPILRVQTGMSTVEVLQICNYNLKASLVVDGPNIQQALMTLRDLQELQCTSADLDKVPDLVYTLRKVRRYRPNPKVLKKAEEVYSRMKAMYLTPHTAPPPLSRRTLVGSHKTTPTMTEYINKQSSKSSSTLSKSQASLSTPKKTTPITITKTTPTKTADSESSTAKAKITPPGVSVTTGGDSQRDGEVPVESRDGISDVIGQKHSAQVLKEMNTPRVPEVQGPAKERPKATGTVRLKNVGSPKNPRKGLRSSARALTIPQVDSSKTAVEGEGGATTSTASESRESAKEKELPSKEKEVKPSQERGGQEVVPQEREEQEGVVSQEREGQGVSLLGEGERHEAKSSHTEEEHSSDQIVPS